MNWLRSSIIVAFLSLFVFVGYGEDALCGCENGFAPQQTEQHSDDCDDCATGKACQCVCQQPVVQFAVLLSEPSMTPDEEVNRLPIEDEFPADTVPIGIDYPPQIA